MSGKQFSRPLTLHKLPCPATKEAELETFCAGLTVAAPLVPARLCSHTFSQQDGMVQGNTD